MGILDTMVVTIVLERSPSTVCMEEHSIGMKEKIVLIPRLGENQAMGLDDEKKSQALGVDVFAAIVSAKV